MKMTIEPTQVTVRDLTVDYEDNQEAGVVGFGRKLDIRPPYQREFVYKDKQREAVIDTLIKGYPLNVMYWAVRDDVPADDERVYEVMDGQQRTISVCQYVAGDFAFEGRYFHNLQPDEKEHILDYELTVYLCSGPPSEKLAWFETINIAGEELTQQELRNAVFAGPWVSSAKGYFSKTGCPAYGLGSKYVTGELNRQAYLETAIKWISGGDIKGYMATHQHDPNALELWLYFQNVITWAEATFPVYRAPMKSVAWGDLYNAHKGTTWDAAELEARVATLMQDEDVTRKKGIYPYVLDGQEKHLNIRAFTTNQKREAYERQKGICPFCTEHYEFEEMHADHIKPWHKGGRTEASNCQMLCITDNLSKGGS